MALEFIARNGLIAQNNSTITGSLTVTSGIIASSITGSMSGTSSFATSASYAATSSFASNFNVANTLTATTLVVNTISSSVTYSSGSNIFGNSLSNKQVMTGSLQVTGSRHYLLCDTVGIGTTSPNTLLGLSTNAAFSAVMDIQNTSATGSSAIDFYTNTGTYIGNVGGAIYHGNLVVDSWLNGISFRTSNTERMRIVGSTVNITGSLTATGLARSAGINIGSGYQMEFSDDGNTTFAYIEGSSFSSAASYVSVGTAGTERMRITSAGRIGIGTSSPSYRLTVTSTPGSASFDGINVTTGTADVASLYRTGTSYSYGMVGANQSWMYSNFGDLNIMTDASSASIKFGTSGGTERMRIASGGQVLIGTTTVNWLERVSISGTASFNGVVRIENNANPVDVNHGILNLVNTLSYAVGNDASVMFSARDSGGTVHPRASIGAKTSSQLGADLVFNTRNNSNFDERMRITSSGNVGIGNTTPATRLHVTGTISAVDLQLSGTYAATYTTSNSWTNWQTVIPSATLVGGATYLVTLYFITDDWPWQVNCSFTYSPVNSNGAGANNTFTPLISNHTGDGAMIYARNVAAFGQVCGALQVYFAGFSKNVGTLTVKAHRLV